MSSSPRWPWAWLPSPVLCVGKHKEVPPAFEELLGWPGKELTHGATQGRLRLGRSFEPVVSGEETSG